ncbi:hypothetical protein B0I35DRAFT_184942 [Stachybotrys elegans]|uniref:Uncharacterized protein n=1 Tax=Stachybotrys elegans TaxID=80388 RepID=A0A8K0SYW1_9HYPO|nr:hypothetical protein B0I35DRAFT_184942 [Stachybotrys elegans]
MGSYQSTAHQSRATRWCSRSSPEPDAWRLAHQSSKDHKSWRLLESFIPQKAMATVSATSPKWLAIMEIFAENLPSLMRNGLYWTEANLDPDGGYIAKPRDNKLLLYMNWASHSFTHARVYFLSEQTSASGADGNWVARLIVFAHDVRTLGDFKLDQLSRDTMFQAWGVNPDGHGVYSFSRARPQSNFNTIVVDGPLKGFWPAPVGEEVRDGQEDLKGEGSSVNDDGVDEDWEQPDKEEQNL